MEKDSNTSLRIYYLLIFIFILLIAIPPLFRYLMPNENINKKTNTINNNTNKNNNQNSINPNDNQNTNTIKLLSCTLVDDYATYYTNTSYSNDVISSVNFVYILKSESLPANGKLNNMYTVINNLKTVSGAVVQEADLQVSVQFNLANGNSIVNELKPYTQTIDVQKSTYESGGFTCSIE